jgi:ABC-2 type transport system ATP-binding protein
MAKDRGVRVQTEDSNEAVAIKVEHVNKTFRLPHNRQSSLKGSLINLVKGGERTYEKQEVLKDISFEIKKGEFFGIVGRNGSGKSTLLKLLAGIYVPDKGLIQISGSLTPFIELGVGFNSELTGRENIYLNGALLGFSKSEMELMYDSIVEFAELDNFMDQKLKNYSSGMQVRLAFSIAIRAESDILLLDEVLAVGDSNFQRKCFSYFEELKKSKKTIIFVSHDMSSVKRFCDKVLVLDKGKNIYNGITDKAVSYYNELNIEYEKALTDIKRNTNRKVTRLGNEKATIEDVYIQCNGRNNVKKIPLGTNFKVIFKIKAKENEENVTVGIMFKNALGNDILGCHSLFSKNSKNIGELKKGQILNGNLEFENIFIPGKYSIMIACAKQKSYFDYELLDLIDGAVGFEISDENAYWGPLNTTFKINIEVE